MKATATRVIPVLLIAVVIMSSHFGEAPANPDERLLTVKVEGLFPFYVKVITITVDQLAYSPAPEGVLKIWLSAAVKHKVVIGPTLLGGGHGPPLRLFSHWSGDGSGSDPEIEILLDRDEEIVANYVPGVQIMVMVVATVPEAAGVEVPVYVNGTREFITPITSQRPYCPSAPEGFGSWHWWYFKINSTILVSVDEFVFRPAGLFRARSRSQLVSEPGEVIFVYEPLIDPVASFLVGISAIGAALGLGLVVLLRKRIHEKP